MTSTPIDKIRARIEAATPGPWEVRAARPRGAQVVGPRKPSDLMGGPVTLMQPIFWDEQSERNAEFIAHARTDVTKLLDAVEAVLDLVRDTDEIAYDLDDAERVIREALA